MIVIYKIECLDNSKVYIGITENLNHRLKVHFGCYNKNTLLSRAIKKYGRDSFQVTIIDMTDFWEEGLEKEIEYIKLYKSYNSKFGYNMTMGGEGIPGLKHTDETKKKMSESHMGKGLGEDNPMYGKPSWNKGKKMSPESRKKLSESCKGRVLSEETKKKISGKLKGSNNSFYGKTHTEETKKRLRELKLGSKHTKETKEKMCKSRKGKYVGEEHSQSKVTEEQVREIRQMYENKKFNQSQLASMYNITQSNVYCIVNYKSWKHI
jgi:group I intron endonuclease